MGMEEKIEEKIYEAIAERDVKASYVRKMNNFVTISLAVFFVLISVYFALAAQTRLNAVGTYMNVIRQSLTDLTPWQALQAQIGGISTLYFIQLIVFLLASAALVVSLRFVSRRYTVVRKNALTDSLTNTYNKKAILFALKKEILRTERYGHPTSIAIVDIDFFKKYNDANGHVAGDNLLKKFAGIIKKTIRDYDVFGRFGGEEFIIVFPETPIKEASMVCERLRKNVENTEFKGRSKMPNKKVTISVGLSEVYGKRRKGKTKKDPKKLLDEADELLYKAKDTGRNKVISSKNSK